jgi:hypothetical protein
MEKRTSPKRFENIVLNPDNRLKNQPENSFGIKKVCE